jgi:hypothetical protein
MSSGKLPDNERTKFRTIPFCSGAPSPSHPPLPQRPFRQKTAATTCGSGAMLGDGTAAGNHPRLMLRNARRVTHPTRRTWSPSGTPGSHCRCGAEIHVSSDLRASSRTTYVGIMGVPCKALSIIPNRLTINRLTPIIDSSHSVEHYLRPLIIDRLTPIIGSSWRNSPSYRS